MPRSSLHPPAAPAASRYTLAAAGLAALLLLAACGKGEAPAASSAASAPAAAAAKGQDGKGAATPPAVLLLAPEDVRAVESSLTATGPVISGSLQPERRADLRAEVGATVQEVLRDNGEAVRAGDLIVRLDEIGRASCRERCRSRWSPYH